jgi:RNA polymerase sigma-70 factor (ECF subfamily)
MTRQAAIDPVVAAATAGDEPAFAELVARHEPELRAHAFQILGSHHDAEDVAQETFLRAWRKRESFRGASSYRGWLYAIATNASLTALERRQRRHLRLLADHVDSGAALEALPAPGALPDDEVVANETLELALRSTIRGLPPIQRAVLFLRDLLGWSANDTAALLDTSVASVNSALQRARSTLRAELSEPREEWPRVA